MSGAYSAESVRFTRLLALISRNLGYLDETDREIYAEARDWFYRQRVVKGPRGARSSLPSAHHSATTSARQAIQKET